MSQKERPARLRFDSFELDPKTGELTKHGRRIRLQDQPSRLLLLLADRAGSLVTREQIQHALWGEDRFVEFDHAINTAVKKIREALGDDVERPRLIETLPRKGYRFIGKVEHVALARPDVVDPPAEPLAETGDDSPKGLQGMRSDSALLSPGVARVLFLFIQVGYLTLYCSALYFIGELTPVLDVFGPVSPDVTLSLVVVTAMCGIAVRLYLASSVGLGHPAAGLQFERLFPAVLLLDGLWSASPLLATPDVRFGLALAAAAGLAYLPFSQRTLIRNIYSFAER